MGCQIRCSTNTDQPTTQVDVCGMGWKGRGNSDIEPDVRGVTNTAYASNKRKQAPMISTRAVVISTMGAQT